MLPSGILTHLFLLLNTSTKQFRHQSYFYEDVSHSIFANAKHLRKNMTDAETVLWMYLKEGINGLKFRRQHPIGIYIADFYCHKARLIIEIDGERHNGFISAGKMTGDEKKV